jgi:LacI family transcriptional regulator
MNDVAREAGVALRTV